MFSKQPKTEGWNKIQKEKHKSVDMRQRNIDCKAESTNLKNDKVNIKFI